MLHCIIPLINIYVICILGVYELWKVEVSGITGVGIYSLHLYSAHTQKKKKKKKDTD